MCFSPPTNNDGKKFPYSVGSLKITSDVIIVNKNFFFLISPRQILEDTYNNVSKHFGTWKEGVLLTTWQEVVEFRYFITETENGREDFSPRADATVERV